jgi:chemotaxis regulatin CheY-phosphate phosphatase CheZ
MKYETYFLDDQEYTPTNFLQDLEEAVNKVVKDTKLAAEIEEEALQSLEEILEVDSDEYEMRFQGYSKAKFEADSARKLCTSATTILKEHRTQAVNTKRGKKANRSRMANDKAR